MKSNFIGICLRAGVLVLCASAVGIAFNTLSPRGVSLLKEPPKPPVGSTVWTEITSEAARELFGRAVFVDARAREDFQAGRIEGAVNLPVGEFDALWMDFSSAVPPEMELIIYCGGGDCEMSHKLAERLAQAGYKNLRVLTDGFYAWRAHKFPVAQGGG